jgi:predicted transcriptional regulator
MKCLKLEEYITILQALLIHGPIQLSEMESLVGIDRFELRKDLAFLLEENAITKKPSGESSAYVASPLGVRLVNYFGLNPLIKE